MYAQDSVSQGRIVHRVWRARYLVGLLGSSHEMRVPAWIDELWRRLMALIQRIFGPARAALAPSSAESPGSDPTSSPPATFAPLDSEAARAIEEPAEPVSPAKSANVVIAAEPATPPATEAVAVTAIATPTAANVTGANGLQIGARPAVSVRRYFGRLVAATPAGLTIDFTRWQAASVERYFLAITSPGLIRRREAPTTGAEVLRLPNAFDGFEWD